MDLRLAASESADELTAVVSHVASVSALILHFLSDNDLLLLPSQSLALESSLRSLTRLLQTIIIKAQITTPQSPPPLSLQLQIPRAPPRPHSWFLRFLSSAPDPRWVETFRMSRSSFHLLLQTLSPSLHSSPLLPIPSDHKLGAAVFRLAHAAPFATVARRFGLPSPTLACRAFYETCRAVAHRLAHLFELPSDITRVLQGFHWMSLPNCCGALSFAQFPLGVVAQALVDSEGRFLDISAGWRSSSPAQILPRTSLYSSQSSVLATGPPVQLHGGSVPRYLLGRSCCPLLPWLLTPFPAVDSSKAAAFNAVHARGVDLADRAFARVRARWKLLETEWKEECVEALPFVIVVGCLLHNYLIKCSEPMPDESELRARGTGFPDFDGEEDEGGKKGREVLATHLALITARRK